MAAPAYDMRVSTILVKIQAMVATMMPVHHGSWFVESSSLQSALSDLSLDESTIQYITSQWKPLFEEMNTLNVISKEELTHHVLTGKGTLAPSATYIMYADMVSKGIEVMHKIVLLLLGDGTDSLPPLVTGSHLATMQAHLDQPSSLFFSYLRFVATSQ